MLYYQYDEQRNVSEVTDRHGDIIEQYRYDAFGGIFTGTTTPYNHHGYTGMRYDGKTGLVDLNARWYNPTAGKFLSEDTYPGELALPQTQNRYSYALNNPINLWDPSGHVAVGVDEGTGAIPSWVRAQRDYDSIEKQNGLFTNYHYWDFVGMNKTTSDTRLVKEVMEARQYTQTYQRDVSNTWTYDYTKMTTITIDDLERKYDDDYHSTETFRENYTEEWIDFISAEEIAGQNAEEIAKYGAPASAKMLGIKISRPDAFDSYVDRERNKHLRQIQPSGPKNHTKKYYDELFQKWWDGDNSIYGNADPITQQELNRRIGEKALPLGPSYFANGLLTGIGFAPISFGGVLGVGAKAFPRASSAIKESKVLTITLGTVDDGVKWVNNKIDAITNVIKNKTGSIPKGTVKGTYSPANPGPLKQSVAETFSGATYKQIALTEDTTFYRVYGGEAGKVGSYMTRVPQNGGIQSQIDLALKPEWGNTTQYVTKVVVPKGNVIYEGTAAPQTINGGAGHLIGGGNQVYIPEVNANWFSK
ncbi:RHS repeat-associated core domain-containing protein [Paenisporosarcina cavernae]|uniref:RHS repeat-associated core domain-containing protein n=1 Tax=Paenisporosarcina cavernae TaxID=2320858 RepID=UPI0013C52420|nr:RHS repeat-associated core domain-containing protein [Paenisporosarcina cavernae]